MKIERKHIIAGVIGLVTVTGALLYLQYKKLMNYKISLKTLKVNTLSATVINFDLYLNFVNNSDIEFNIIEQEYNAYLNNSHVIKAVNYSKNKIYAKKENRGPSIIGVNVSFNPTKVLNVLGKNYLTILTQPENVKIKIEVKLKASIYGFKITIPYVFESTLKALIDSSKAPKDQTSVVK